MFRQRVLVILFLLPLVIGITFLGGVVYIGVVVLICSIASFEYVKLFRTGGFKPSVFLVVGGTITLIIFRAVDNFQSTPWLLSLIIFTSIIYHLASYEEGQDQAGTDFGLTLSGILYIGWLGAFLVSIRSLPEGQYWLLLVLPSVWFSDSGAYIIGSLIGKHPITKRLSPHKTWEGYFGGILVSVPLTTLLAILWRTLSEPISAITPSRAAILALVLSSIAILGDLGASLIKRQVGAKDSGKLLPGHGGAFDRIDTWLWAGAIGYFIITTFFL